jgi:hypothetical protein
VLTLQRARTRCGNGGAGDGGRARGAAADAGGDRYGRVQQGTVAEAAEGGEGDGQGEEVAGRHDGRVKAAARTDTMRERGGGGRGTGTGSSGRRRWRSLRESASWCYSATALTGLTWLVQHITGWGRQQLLTMSRVGRA